MMPRWTLSIIPPSLRFWLVGVGLVALLIGGTGLAAPMHEDDPAAAVDMTNTLQFTPRQVEIQQGETVEWRNTSVLMHTVTADPEEATLSGSVALPEGATPFDSGRLQPDDTFQHTFEVPGTYWYFCIPHEGAKMRGTVIVR